MKKILFNDVRKQGKYTKNISVLFSDYELFRKKHFSEKCISHLQERFPGSRLFLTHSATGSLEMIAALLDIKPGDEVIMPSFSFVSTANAFVSKGATPVFVDIHTDTLSLDETLVEAAITPATKAVVAMHYAGHPCNLDALKNICLKHRIVLIEDAAMAYGNNYHGEALGSIGDFGVISFDITKHISAIQGGLLLVNNKDYANRASHIYHIGTNRDDFSNGNVPYYEWVDIGSKYQMNELNAAVLYDDLQHEEEVFNHRKTLSRIYAEELMMLEENGYLKLMNKKYLASNIHEFYIQTASENERTALAAYLAQNQVEALFHYIPLHASKKGIETGRSGSMVNTNEVAAKLLRLPLHMDLNIDSVRIITGLIRKFYA